MKTKILAITLAVSALALLTAVAFVSNLAIYISIIAIGLALALQKYVASYFGYFIIVFSNMVHVGDRIRIGNFKGDVRHIGIFYLTLDEVGEDEKLGGELTGKILHIPNLVLLDQPLLNFSKGVLKGDQHVPCEYIFDEIRIPISAGSDIALAADLLEGIIEAEDREYLEQSKAAFAQDYPSFMREAETDRKVLIHVEPDKVWLKGKFVAPFRIRNELRTRMYMRFLEESGASGKIKLV